MPPRRHISPSNVLGAIVVSCLILWLSVREIDGRALMIFVCTLGVTECFLQMRWRASLPCRHCGFDPALYLGNRQLAVERVRAHLEKRQKNPLTIFSRQPRLDLPIRRMKASAPGQKGGLAKTQAPASILSKTV